MTYAVNSVKWRAMTWSSSSISCCTATRLLPTKPRNPFIRELNIPFGRTGYVALFEVVDSTTVIIGAIRHQREDDYH